MDGVSSAKRIAFPRPADRVMEQLPASIFPFSKYTLGWTDRAFKFEEPKHRISLLIIALVLLYVFFVFLGAYCIAAKYVFNLVGERCEVQVLQKLKVKPMLQ